jgi:hypothetical protein
MTDEPDAHRRPRHSAEKDSHTGFTVVLCDDCEVGDCDDNEELPILAVLRETVLSPSPSFPAAASDREPATPARRY